MRIRAEFTGENGSMHFFTGQHYILQVLLRNGDSPEIVKAEPPALTPCPYGSWNAFWKNWKKLK